MSQLSNTSALFYAIKQDFYFY